MAGKRLLSLAGLGHAVNVSSTAPTSTASSVAVITGRPGDPPALSRLYAAAADAFAERGFHATTTRDIASRAGMSPAGVYVHFQSKEELLYQLCREGHEAALAALTQAARQAQSPSIALTQVVSTFARWHAQEYRVARIVQYEFRHLSVPHQALVLQLRKQIDEVVGSILRAGVEQGCFQVSDIPTTALAINSMCVDVARWYRSELRRTPQEIGTATAGLALRLVGAPGSPARSDEALHAD